MADLAERLGGQVRTAGSAVIGFDMGAALALGAALGVPALAVAELLPGVEAAMVSAANADRGERSPPSL